MLELFLNAFIVIYLMISADNDLNKLNLCDVFTALCQTLGTAGLILDNLPNP